MDCHLLIRNFDSRRIHFLLYIFQKFPFYVPKIFCLHPGTHSQHHCTCRQFVYKKDFNIGDVVQVVNEYGQEATSRVTEIVISQDENGESLNPTFTSTEKADN